MNSFTQIIGEIITPVIVILAVFTLLGFGYVVFKIKQLKLKMDEDHKASKKNYTYTAGGVLKTPEKYTLKEMIEYKDKFNKIQLSYHVFAQFIPIFPLLGILGTVSGMIGLIGDSAAMWDAVSTSMKTTFWGLLAAIILRFFDSFLVSKQLYGFQLVFDDYDRIYMMTRDDSEQETETN